jgi:hypothetical protein
MSDTLKGIGMSTLRRIFGILIILGGIVLAVWLDLFVLFIGGINEIIAGFNATPHNGHEIAWGFVRTILFTGLGTVAGVIVILIGAALVGWRLSRRNA